MTLADDGRDYKVEPLPDAMRRADAVRQDVRLHDRMSLDVYAQTRADALALADRAGRLAVEAVVRDRCAPRLAVIAHGTGRYWIGEDRCADPTPC